MTQVGGIILHLLLKVSNLKPRQTGNGDAVAGSVQPMTGETGVPGAAVPAAHRHPFAGACQSRAGLVRGQAATAEHDAGCKHGKDGGEQTHP